MTLSAFSLRLEFVPLCGLLTLIHLTDAVCLVKLKLTNRPAKTMLCLRSLIQTSNKIFSIMMSHSFMGAQIFLRLFV